MALTEKLKAIADAIRGKTGKTDGLTLDQMPTEIEGIQSGGGEVYQTRAGAMYTPIFSTGDLPFNVYQTSSNLLRYADKLIEATFPNWTIVHGGANGDPVSNSTIERLHMPRLSTTSTFVARACTNLKTAVLGGIGYPVNSLSGYTFDSCTQADLTITLYVADDAALPLAGSPWGATNATIIYRNSTTGEVITE